MWKKCNVYWLWMPVVHCLSLALGIVLFYQWMLPGVWELMLFMGFYSLIVSPVISFFYAKRIRGMGWWKYLCVVYNAVLSGGYLFAAGLSPDLGLSADFVLAMMSYITATDHLSYFVLGLLSNGVLITSLLCGIITLVIYDVKRKRACKTCTEEILK